MIFNDPIMNDHHTLGSDVRMGICLGHTTMRGPARMADANITTKRLFTYQTVETCQLANRTGDFKTAAIVGDNASTVIAAIFQPPQRIQERVTTIDKADSPYDSTHMKTPSKTRPQPDSPSFVIQY